MEALEQTERSANQKSRQDERREKMVEEMEKFMSTRKHNPKYVVTHKYTQTSKNGKFKGKRKDLMIRTIIKYMANQ